MLCFCGICHDKCATFYEFFVKSCTFAMKSCSCAGGYPLCISVPTPYHTIVGEFATFHNECATFHNFFFAKIIFDNKFDIKIRKINVKNIYFF